MNYCTHCNDGSPFYLKWQSITTNKLLKYIVVMKLIILLTIMGLQVSAAALGQQVTLNVKNAPLYQIMKDLQKQSGYSFFMKAEDTKTANPVTLNLKDASIEKTLQIIFTNQPLKYEINGKMIILTPKEKPTGNFVEKGMEVSRFITITGKVTDEQGAPLPGASVRASGKATVTNEKGEFTLSGVEENAAVGISYLGYITKTVKATGDFILAQLQTKAGELSETVIKGYYKTTKELNTGSVGVIKAIDIAKQPVNDFTMALQGRIAGLNVVQTSGVPGAPLTINVRGFNSIANGNEPLYIIDGVPFPSTSIAQLSNATGGNRRVSPLNSIRPDNIESVTVLKDADATAIYGSRGANGVILISTKQGKAGQTKVDLNAYQGISKVPKFFDLMNTSQYLAMRNEAFKNDNATPNALQYDVNGTWDKNRYTDWQKTMVGGIAKVTDATASISGGTALTQYLFSGGYRHETTVFPGDYPNNLGSANLSISHRSENNKFRLSLSTNYAYSNYRVPLADFTNFIYMAPNAPAIYDEKGNLNWQNGTFQNPIANTLQKAQTVTDNLVTNLGLSYQLFTGLELKLNTGYNLIKLDENQIIPATSLIQRTGDDITLSRSYSRGNSNTRTVNLEPQLNYIHSIGLHHFEGLIASTFQSTNQQGDRIDAFGYSSDALIENPAFATYKSAFTSYSQYRYTAVFGRIGYNYNGKYILNLTGRRDGSSRFGESNRFGNFGAVGAAWIFSKEAFIKNNLSFLSFGKIRGSIGRTGNDQLGDYQYLSTYMAQGASYSGGASLAPSKLTNPYFGWETIDKLELGMELGFLNDRLHVNVNFFRNRTKNQLVGYSLSPSAGFSTVTANLPAVIQNKGWEMELSSTNLETARFSWHSSFNLTLPKSKLISFPNLAGTSYATTYVVGQPMRLTFLYQYTGIDANTGLYTFEDLNKDGRISSVDDRKPMFIGQKFYGGLSNTFNYGGLSLDIFFQFVKQTGRKYVGKTLPGVFSQTSGNQPTLVLDHWTKPGDKTAFQRFNSNNSASAPYSRFVNSNAIITDASFLRLKNIMASYTISSEWIQKIHMQQVRVYLQAQNLLTFTKYKNADPESGVGGIPPLRTTTAGLQFTF